MSKLPFLKPEYTRTFFLEWQLFEDAQGCAPLQHDGLCLQMHKSPPALTQTADQARAKVVVAPVAKTPAPLPPPKKETAQAFLEWMIERKEKSKPRPRLKTNPSRHCPNPLTCTTFPQP